MFATNPSDPAEHEHMNIKTQDTKRMARDPSHKMVIQAQPIVFVFPYMHMTAHRERMFLPVEPKPLRFDFVFMYFSCISHCAAEVNLFYARIVARDSSPQSERG